jgi:hypothetical protein
LAEARAVKSANSKLWSPEDAIRAMLRDIENGEIKPKEMAVWYFEEAPDGGQTLCCCVAGLDRQGHVYLLNNALRRVLEDALK